MFCTITFPRIIAELMRRVFVTPMIRYFDDCGSLLPASHDRGGLLTFSRWCQLLGISQKLTKSDVGPEIAFLGIHGSFPTDRNGIRLRATVTPEKAAMWTSIIRQHLQDGRISHPEPGEIIGMHRFL